MEANEMARRIVVAVAKRLYGVDDPVIDDLAEHARDKIKDDTEPEEAIRMAAAALMQMLAFPALDGDEVSDDSVD